MFLGLYANNTVVATLVSPNVPAGRSTAPTSLIFVINHALIFNHSLIEDIEFDKTIAILPPSSRIFTAFSKNSNKKSCVREIFSINFKKHDDIIEIYFEGDGFLYNMVRMITGSLINYGLNKISLKEIEILLENKKRDSFRYTAPPQGLFLYQVFY